VLSTKIFASIFREILESKLLKLASTNIFASIFRVFLNFIFTEDSQMVNLRFEYRKLSIDGVGIHFSKPVFAEESDRWREHPLSKMPTSKKFDRWRHNRVPKDRQ